MLENFFACKEWQPKDVILCFLSMKRKIGYDSEAIFTMQKHVFFIENWWLWKKSWFCYSKNQWHLIRHLISEKITSKLLIVNLSPVRRWYFEKYYVRAYVRVHYIRYFCISIFFLICNVFRSLCNMRSCFSLIQIIYLLSLFNKLI